jgi:hypothetical protein
MPSPVPGFFRIGHSIAISAVLFTAVGCSRGPVEASLSGLVLFDGKPLRGGTVRLVPTLKGGRVVVAEINENGGYGPVTVVTGEVLVSVDNRTLAPRPVDRNFSLALPKGVNANLRNNKPAAKAVALPPDPRYTPIPDRYYRAEDAEDLKFTVTPGAMSHNIELSSKG